MSPLATLYTKVATERLGMLADIDHHGNVIIRTPDKERVFVAWIDEKRDPEYVRLMFIMDGPGPEVARADLLETLMGVSRAIKGVFAWADKDGDIFLEYQGVAAVRDQMPDAELLEGVLGRAMSMILAGARKAATDLSVLLMEKQFVAQSLEGD